MTKSMLVSGATLAAVLCLASWYFGNSPATADDAKLTARFFEQRTYYTHPGKLGALHDRFRNHTNYLFVKHGMTLIGYWTPLDTDDTLVYVLAYPSREAREKSWQAFLNDPTWKKAYAESTKEGRLVRKIDQLFLRPTEYSPIR